MRLEIRDVTKEYGGFKALAGVSVTLQKGLHGLLGPNGAGKTTLMKVLCTLIKPSSGTVIIDGRDLAADRDALRRRLGYLGQEWDAPKGARCAEVIDLALRLRGFEDARARRAETERALALVGMAERARSKVGTLSGGMVRRLGVAQALAGSPEVIVMDEPTVGLDPDERVEFRNILAHLGREHVILLSTHIVADVGNTCERVTVLSQGLVQFDGPPSELAATARGKVFETTVSPEEEEDLVAGVAGVVFATPTPSGPRLRTIGRPASRFPSEPVEPTLEDAYLLLVPAASGDAAWRA